MMGGGPNVTQTVTEYQPTRQGVDRRQYGELSNGFSSQEEYDAFQEFKASGGTGENKYGFKYDSKYGTYSLANGVDAEAAQQDWSNYRNERIEIATYNAKEARRKKAPDELQSSKTAELTIDNYDGTTKEKKVNTITQAKTTSPSTASTNQALGIY